MRKLIFLITAFMIVAFAGILFSQFDSYFRYVDEETALTQLLIQEEQVAEDLKMQQEFLGSDAYIEKIAREKLHMVKPNEWIIINDQAK